MKYIMRGDFAKHYFCHRDMSNGVRYAQSIGGMQIVGLLTYFIRIEKSRQILSPTLAMWFQEPTLILGK